MYKKGLVSVSFRNKTPEEIIGYMKKAHLDFIEWGSDVHAPCEDTENLLYLKKLCEENGIKISSYGTYFRLGSDKADEIAKYINAAKILGTDIIRIWAGIKSFSQYNESELSKILEEARQIAQIAEENGVTVCLERHTGTITDLPDGALFLMNGVQNESFAMYYQPCQHNGKEFSVDFAEKIAVYTKVAHVFNWCGNSRYPLADAVCDWKEYLKKLPDDIYVLLEFMPDDRIESLEEEALSLYKICEGEKI